MEEGACHGKRADQNTALVERMFGDRSLGIRHWYGIPQIRLGNTECTQGIVSLSFIRTPEDD